MNRRRKRETYLLGLAFLVLLLVFIYSGVQVLESTVFFKEEIGTTYRISKTIERDGVEYFPRQDMTVLMVMGIDQTGEVKDSGSYNNPGAVDAVMLMVFDVHGEILRGIRKNRNVCGNGKKQGHGFL